MSYDALKQWLRIVRRRVALSTLEVFVLGVLSKMAATVATYPLQLAQSRLRWHKFAHLSLLGCLGNVYREHGFLALFEVRRPWLALCGG